MLLASVLYGGQEGLKPLSFKMCAFQGEKPLTNRLLTALALTLAFVLAACSGQPAETSVPAQAESAPEAAE